MKARNASKNILRFVSILKGLAIVSVATGLFLVISYVTDLRANMTLKSEVDSLRSQTSASDTSQVLTTNEPQADVPTNQQNSLNDRIPNDDSVIETAPTTMTYDFASNDLLPVFRINTDTVGWLNITDTRIDYPVVKGIDNEFYLDHGFDKKPNVTGAIFMDTRNIGDGSDRHTLIYGHRMNDGSMFRDLEKFQDEDFYQSHLEFEFQTLHGTERYRIFSAYVTGTDFLFIRTRFEESEFPDFLLDIKKRGLYPSETDVALNEKSQILTLSTCSRALADARFVVHAVLIEK